VAHSTGTMGRGVGSFFCRRRAVVREERAVGLRHGLGLFGLWAVAGAFAVVVGAGCPKPADHHTTAGPRGSGHHLAPVHLPDLVDDLISFAQQHSKDLDDVDALRQAVAAYQKALGKAAGRIDILKPAVRIACRVAELSRNGSDVGTYTRLTIKWAIEGRSKQPKAVEFVYRQAMALGIQAEAEAAKALAKVKLVEKLAHAAAALDSKYDHGGPLRLLGALYIHAPEVGSVGDPDKGVTIMQRAVGFFPGFGPNHFFLGEGYFKQEEYDKAKIEFGKARDAASGDGYTPRDAQWYRKKAKGYLRKIRRKQPDGTDI